MNRQGMKSPKQPTNQTQAQRIALMSKLEPRSLIRGLSELGPLTFRALRAPTHAGGTLGCRVTPCWEGGPGSLSPSGSHIRRTPCSCPGLHRFCARPFPASSQPAVLRMLRPLRGPALRVLPQPGGQIRARWSNPHPALRRGAREEWSGFSELQERKGRRCYASRGALAKLMI